MNKLVIFCAVVLAITAAFLPVSRDASEGNQPYDVYFDDGWRIAVQDPFVDTIILHGDIWITEIPNIKIKVITDF